jgi:hypothetical protein
VCRARVGARREQKLREGRGGDDGVHGGSGGGGGGGGGGSGGEASSKDGEQQDENGEKEKQLRAAAVAEVRSCLATAKRCPDSGVASTIEHLESVESWFQRSSLVKEPVRCNQLFGQAQALFQRYQGYARVVLLCDRFELCSSLALLVGLAVLVWVGLVGRLWLSNMPAASNTTANNKMGLAMIVFFPNYDHMNYLLLILTTVCHDYRFFWRHHKSHPRHFLDYRCSFLNHQGRC